MCKLFNFLLQMGKDQVQVQRLSIVDDNQSCVEISHHATLIALAIVVIVVVVIVECSLEHGISQKMYTHQPANAHHERKIVHQRSVHGGGLCKMCLRKHRHLIVVANEAKI